MPKVDIAGVPVDTKITYPEPFGKPLDGRQRKRLGNSIGLDQFGVNLTTLKPGAQSSQRHWHMVEDEFVYVLDGEVVMVEDGGETVLKAGEAAGWKANSGNGHCLVNRTQRDAVFLEIGARGKYERTEYSDIDMRYVRDETGFRYLHKSGQPYPKK